MSEMIVKINGLARDTGEGVAQLEEEEGGVVMVRDALPGERVRIQLEGRSDGFPAAKIVELIEPSKDRQKAVCRHYGVCGGCTMQLLRPSAYLDWKRSWIVGLLAVGAVIETDIAPMVPVGEGTRRRAVFGVRRTKKTVQLGYRKRASHDLVQIEQCPVLAPAITSQLKALQNLVRPLLSRKGTARLTVLATENGLDIALDDAKPVDSVELREQLVELARDMPVARLVVNEEVLVEFAPPLIRFGNLPLTPPPKAFLQATQPSQQAMISHILSLLPQKKSAQIVDLFAGLGTFTLPVAQSHKVLAVEMEASLLTSLQAAAEKSEGLKPVEVLTRDLFKMPLSVLELRPFSCAIIDPPRAGARAQVEQLAQSAVATILYVSCDPNHFKRDARILLEGGYKLKSITPFDQFLYASHIELIAHFIR